MIKSFRHKGLKRLYHRNDRKGVSPELADKIARVLARLDVAKAPEQMDVPGLNLHPLKGELRGFWSVWVSGNWRIIFRFEGADVMQVDWWTTTDENLRCVDSMELAMPMEEPPHPGFAVRHDCLEPLGLTITEGAKVLGVSRQALNSLVNGKAGISAEMAIRLDKAFGGTADAWLALQTAYDLVRAKKTAGAIAVKRYVARPRPREPQPV